MASRQEVFEGLLGTLISVDGVDGAMIVSGDGEVIGSNVSKGFAQDKIAALASSVVTALTRVATEMKHGEPDMVTIESDHGKFAVVNAEHGREFIIVFGSKDVNVGMIKMELRDAIATFDETAR